MIHYCMDQLKGKKRVILNDDIIKQIESHDNHMVLEVEEAMMQLDDRSREILTLMYFNDLKIKEIAQVLDRPEGTIKTWLKDRKSTRLNSSHVAISYAVFCLKKKNTDEAASD